MLQLDAQVLGALKHIQVLLCLPNNEVIKGYMVEDMDFSGSSEFENVIGGKYIDQLSRGNDILDVVQFGLGVAASTAKSLVGAGSSSVEGLRNFFGNYRIMFLEQTRLAWKQSGRLSPTVNFLVVEIDDEDDTIFAAKRLLRTTFPTRGSDEGADVEDERIGVVRNLTQRALRNVGNLSLVRPPLGYHPGRGVRGSGIRGGSQEGVQGGVALKIGNWFQSESIFVITGCTTRLSKVITDTGRPLWMAASVQLSSFQMNTADEIERMFKNGDTLDNRGGRRRNAGVDDQTLEASIAAGVSRVGENVTESANRLRQRVTDVANNARRDVDAANRLLDR